MKILLSVYGSGKAEEYEGFISWQKHAGQDVILSLINGNGREVCATPIPMGTLYTVWSEVEADYNRIIASMPSEKIRF